LQIRFQPVMRNSLRLRNLAEGVSAQSVAYAIENITFLGGQFPERWPARTKSASSLA
jgi:hypothetical protein